ncbi:MFS transporter [Streptomyces triticirhizae]|uniref:MFS transporter n=1 Tax=Streptomyces triticirhizae TaxID=2483353 RepID=A0A3M2KUQ7_9ACTN|nr:MFS transporter [Streptomyces triticirhizae]RMI28881.1 MFS transporter [Streptomyces triticirhizae]
MRSQAAAVPAASPFAQPKAVFAVAFACVVSFMGIGLVDPILPAISEDLDATPSQVTLLFTSYLVVTAVAMLITGWVSSRLGAKRTLLLGLAIVVVFSALAGASGSIGGIVGFRAGWGVGNALFIATSLAVIIASASGGFVGAIVLYETALGLGIAVGPLLGGLLGEVSWRGPFFGVAVLMAIAMLATWVLVQPDERGPDGPGGPARERTRLREPLLALRHRGLLTMSLTALCYNWAFFTVLGYAPFPMGLGAIQLGLVFTGWGLMVAFFSVFGAPWLRRRLGIARTLYGNLTLFALVVLVIAVWTEHNPVLITAVIVAGVFIGVNNTVTTQAVMTVSPVPRPVASAAYGFVRFIGGGLAPYVAGKLVEASNVHVPFYVAAGALLLGLGILATAHRLLGEAERAQAAEAAHAPAEPAAPAALIPADGDQPATVDAVIAAIGAGPEAEAVAAAAARLARADGRPVDVVRVREFAVSGQGTAEAESLDAALATVREQVGRLNAEGVHAVGHVLPAALGHSAAGRLLAEHARAVGARAMVIGAPRHGGLPALMDASASGELLRRLPCDLVIVNGHEREPLPAG